MWITIEDIHLWCLSFSNMILMFTMLNRLLINKQLTICCFGHQLTWLVSMTSHNIQTGIAHGNINCLEMIYSSQCVWLCGYSGAQVADASVILLMAVITINYGSDVMFCQINVRCC